MFFPERIISIGPKDRVLEIGPGGQPHERSDVFLDLDPKLFGDDGEAERQRGLAATFETDKPIVYYDGRTFPFKDNEFDYVICSHVLEHVTDVAAFCSEMFRIAKKGYVEYPTIYYDYLYNFDVHVNFLKKTPRGVLCMPKDQTVLEKFAPVQALFYRSLELGHAELVDALRDYFFEGFEWRKPFTVAKAKTIEELCWPSLAKMPIPASPPVARRSITRRVAGKVKRIILTERKK